MKSLTALAVLACAAAAPAQMTLRTVPNAPRDAESSFGVAGSGGRPAARSAGDTIDVAVTAFAEEGGGPLVQPASHAVGGATELVSAAPKLRIPDLKMTSEIIDDGVTRTITVMIRNTNGDAIAPAGLAVGRSAVDCVFFELPNVNAGTDLFEDKEKAGPASGVFELIGADGEAIFSDAAGVTDRGSSFGVTNGVETEERGADIFDERTVGDRIVGARFTISYDIPTPGATSLLGLAGLMAVRRRR